MSTLERRLARALVVITSAMIASGCREPIKSTRPETQIGRAHV